MDQSDDEDFWNTSVTKAKALSFDDDFQLVSRDILAFGQNTSNLLSRNDNSLFANVTHKAHLIPLPQLVSNNTLDMLIRAQSGLEPSKNANSKYSHSEMDVTITLKRLILNRPCCLYEHKSLKSKTQLLDGAILIGDGSVILNVVMFLVQTLKRKLLYELLSTRPTAVSHYISFLFLEGKISELTDLLTMLGRSSEAAMYNFQHNIKSSGNNVDLLLKKLHNTLANHFNQPGIDAKLNKVINEYIKLLEWNKCMNVQYLNNKSPLHCLTYCCENYWNEGSGKMTSPLTICQQQNLSPMQFDWTALTVHSALKNWDVIESLFTKKDWLGRSTASTSVPIPLIISKLNQSEAPQHILRNFTMRITNTDQRLEIAKQYKIHSVVIETLAKNRDRSALLAYKMMLNIQSEEYFLAENTLRNPAIKWKN